jgi:hypothetical protein
MKKKKKKRIKNPKKGHFQTELLELLISSCNKSRLDHKQRIIPTIREWAIEINNLYEKKKKK